MSSAGPADPATTARRALALGAAHALVDAACAFVLFGDVSGDARLPPPLVSGTIVLYDVLAFSLQVPLGIACDRRAGDRLGIVAGLALVAAALALGAWHALAAGVLAGLGNALFHAGGGAFVLRASGARARDAGLFVGPGSVGLCAGVMLGGHVAALRAPLLVALAITSILFARHVPFMQTAGGPYAPGPRPRASGVVAVMLLSAVVLRSLSGETLSGQWRALFRTDVVVGLALAAALGKMIGGAAADRLGWVRAAAVSLIAGAPLLAIGMRDPMAALAGMLLVQGTTALTLAALHRLLPGRPGLAFGLASLAVLVGAAPGLFDHWPVSSPPAIAVAVGVSALLVVPALGWVARSTPPNGPDATHVAGDSRRREVGS